jgi:hypothetical protein
MSSRPKGEISKSQNQELRRARSLPSVEMTNSNRISLQQAATRSALNTRHIKFSRPASTLPPHAVSDVETRPRAPTLRPDPVPPQYARSIEDRQGAWRAIQGVCSQLSTSSRHM